MEATNHDLGYVNRPESIHDCFKEHSEEFRRSRKSLHDTSHRSRSKRVRADVSEGSAEDNVYQKDLNIIYSTKKQGNRTSEKEDTRKIETPKRTTVCSSTHKSTNFSFNSTGSMRFKENEPSFASSMKKDFLGRQRINKNGLNEHFEMPESIEEQLNESSSMMSKDRMIGLSHFRGITSEENSSLNFDISNNGIFNLRPIKDQKAKVDEYFEHEKGINLEDDLIDILNEDGLKKALDDHYNEKDLMPFTHTPTKQGLEMFNKERVYRENLKNTAFVTPEKPKHQLESNHNTFRNEKLIRLRGISSCSSNSC